MFREMRRKKQQLPINEVEEILQRNNTCTLALIGDNDYPYSLPISYIYHSGKIYFHCAKDGHKLDAIRNNNKISLSVIDCDEVIEKKFTNKYKSVVIFGTARIIEDIKEIESVCRILAEKICPNELDGIQGEIDSAINATTVVEVAIEHITGKEGLEFYKERK